ncbi:MAG: hypothetical protein MJA83_07705, partial [Gammaproteobacteria bacterium]|nr:hypothetical protein [Gammaproteobacteria bacterium]
QISTTPPSMSLMCCTKFAIGDDPAPDAFDFAFDLVPGGPVPTYLHIAFDELAFGKALEDFLGEVAHSRAGFLDAVMLHDLHLYWAAKVLQLPDGSTATPGFGFGGLLEVDHSLGFYLDVDVEATHFTGKGEAGPIDEHGVIKITGEGKGITRKINGKDTVVVKPGGALVDLEAGTHAAPTVILSADVDLLGVEEKLDVHFSEHGLAMQMQVEVTPGNEVTFHYERKSLLATTVNAEFDLDVKADIPLKLPHGPGITIPLDATVHVNFTVDTQKEKMLQIGGDFEFDGAHCSFNFAFETPCPLDKLPEVIVKGIIDNAGDIFSDALNLANDLLKDAKKALKAVDHAIKKAAADIDKDATKALNNLSSTLSSVDGVSESLVNSGISGVRDGISIAEEQTKQIDKAVDSIVEVSASLGSAFHDAVDSLNKAANTAKNAVNTVRNWLGI